MANERKTEQIVINKLRELWYYDNKDILVELQKSDNREISNLLSKASKDLNWENAGYPEFIIRKPNSDVLVVIECKANTKHHESEKKDNPKKYAVDWVLHYASFLKEQFNIIAIAISWETETELKTSIFQRNKKEKRYFPKKFSDISTYADYYEVFHTNDNTILSEQELLDYARKLHNEMRDESEITETGKPIFVAALLIALENWDFVKEYPTITNPNKLASRIMEAIEDTLKFSDIPDKKIKTLLREFSFITTHNGLLKWTIDINNPSHQNNTLHKFLVDIQKKVYPFIKKTNNIDVIGKFYSEFIRYTGWDWNWLWIVLTPTHITDIFCEIAEVNKNSKVIDICTWTGGFLVAAMEHMLLDEPTVSEIDDIYRNNLVWVENKPNMFALACANMIIRWDGKTNLLYDSCFDIGVENLKKYNCNIWLINPPYSQKSYKEFDFIKLMLDSLSVWWIWVAIVPIKCTNSDNDIRVELLKKHTLKAVMIMPHDLFKGSGTHTCIMVFEAHKPHRDDIPTRFSIWDNDEFVNYKNQRIDRYNKWENKKKNWLASYRARTEIYWESTLKCVWPTDEWSALAYVKTNYGTLKKNDFKNTLKDIILHNIRREKNISEFYDILSYVVENPDLEKLFSNDSKDLEIIDTSNWKEFRLWDIFTVVGSKTTPKIKLEEIWDWEYPYVTTRATNNWVDWYYNHYTDEWGVLTIDSATVWYCSYQKNQFSASDHVEKLVPKFNMSHYVAIFIQTLINKEQFRYSYWRKYNQTRIKETKILLPVDKNWAIDIEYIERYISKLPSSSLL